ncbi:MAG: hypothetical protein Ct9H300mP28_22240 [Pseudomonadota bacterium]|nr:MAG: hypothetical protein Ct9H300mP28_22240 [Pseudomonadota bacterium]
MNLFSEQNKQINIRYILLLIFFVKILLFCNVGCSSKVNEKNYNECISLLEDEREKVRVGNGFSYKAQTYEECRAPARYRLDSD